MIYSIYEELPLVLFFKIAKDEKNNLHLLRNGGKASNQELRIIWESHKDRWDEDNPSSEWVQQKTLYKKCLTLSTKIKKDRFFIEFLTSCALVPTEYVFEVAGWPYSTDLTGTIKRINKSLTKDANQLEIYNAQHKALLDKVGEQSAIEKDETNIYEIIGGLQLATSLRLDPKTLTIGDYNGLSKALERKNKLLEQSYGSR